jgi:hypothetical protein
MKSLLPNLAPEDKIIMEKLLASGTIERYAAGQRGDKKTGLYSSVHGKAEGRDPLEYPRAGETLFAGQKHGKQYPERTGDKTAPGKGVPV